MALQSYTSKCKVANPRMGPPEEGHVNKNGWRHRLGRCLFAAEDLRARARGWDVVETKRGLGRTYRDPRWRGAGVRP